MSDHAHTEHCEQTCLPSCEETLYDFSVSIADLDPDEMCADGTDTREVGY